MVKMILEHDGIPQRLWGEHPSEVSLEGMTMDEVASLIDSLEPYSYEGYDFILDINGIIYNYRGEWELQ